MIVFFFSSLAIRAVGRAASVIVEEVRKQFRENKGIMHGTSEPDYAAVWVVAPQAILDILKAQANTLFVISLDNENKWVSIPLAPQARVQIVNKLKSFGYDGGRFGLINAAIQASQNSTQAAVIILTQIYAIEDPFVYYLFDTEAVA